MRREGASLRGGRARAKRGPKQSPLSSPRSPRESTSTTTDSIKVTKLGEVTFGLCAFIESVMKVAFVHLAFFGNSVQASSSSFAKATWLLVYLHCVFDSLRKGNYRKADPPDPSLGLAAVEAYDAAQRRLVLVLEKVDPQVFLDPPAIDEKERWNPCMEPEPGPGHPAGLGGIISPGKGKAVGAIADKDSEQCPPWEECCLPEDAPCRLCGRMPRCHISLGPTLCIQHGRGGWGNAHCRGCSSVDRFGLEIMPVFQSMVVPLLLAPLQKEKESRIPQLGQFSVNVPAGFRPRGLDEPDHFPALKVPQKMKVATRAVQAAQIISSTVESKSVAHDTELLS